MAGVSAQTRQARLQLVRAAVEQRFTLAELAAWMGVNGPTLGRFLVESFGSRAWPVDLARIDQALAAVRAEIAQRGALAWQPSRRHLALVAKVEALFKLPEGVLRLGGRARRYSYARAALALALRESALGLSTIKVGRVLGVDHSSVVVACHLARRLAQEDPVFAERLASFREVVAQSVQQGNEQAWQALLAASMARQAEIAAAQEAAPRPQQQDVSAAVARALAAQVEEHAAREAALVAGVLGIRGTAAEPGERAPREVVLSAQAMQAGSRALLAALRRAQRAGVPA